MFVYYYVHVDRPFEAVEPSLLRMLPGLGGWAADAYRVGERLRARIGTKGGRIAKKVELDVGSPSRGASQTVIPLRWEATGTTGLFPKMEGDIVAAAVGSDLTQIAFRGSYRPPLGFVGGAIDKAVMHRVAEASVKSFVDRIAVAVESHEDSRIPPLRRLKGAER